MKIWSSFESPIAFETRDGILAVLFGTGHNQDMHAHKAASILKERAKAFRWSQKIKKFNSKLLFEVELMVELKKEMIHTSSEVMREAFGVS